MAKEHLFQNLNEGELLSILARVDVALLNNEDAHLVEAAVIYEKIIRDKKEKPKLPHESDYKQYLEGRIKDPDVVDQDLEIIDVFRRVPRFTGNDALKPFEIGSLMKFIGHERRGPSLDIILSAMKELGDLENDRPDLNWSFRFTKSALRG